MDPALAAKLIEGYENELEPALKAQDAFYRQHNCPRCGGNTQKHFLSVQHAFPGIAGEILPRSGLKCLLCECVFDPHSGMIVELGNAGKINDKIRASQVPHIK